MMGQANRQTTEQRRAASAWACVSHAEACIDESDRKKYGTWARKLPSLILTNGLGPVTAFFLAKAGGNPSHGQRLLYDHLSAWLISSLGYKGGDLLHMIHNGSAELYRRATTEAIAYSIWLRRYVEAKGWGGEDGD